jgi:hypothetical protein
MLLRRRLPRLILLGAALISVAALAAALLGASPLALAAPPPASAASTGELDGNVLDGTTGGTPIAGQSVSLTLTNGPTTRTVTTTTTDAHGRFQFSGLATDPGAIYIATAQVQGVVYSTDPVTFAGTPRLEITLLAYESTSVATRIGFSLVTYQLAQTSADVLAGTIHVTELVNVVNGDQRTFVGTPGPAANGQPMSLLRFGLPGGASNLAPHDGFTQGQLLQVDRGFATTTPVLPGQMRFTFSYDVPYQGTQFALAYHAVYPTSQVLVVFPATLTATAPGFTSLGTVKLGGQPVAVWQATTIFPGNSVSLALAHLPAPGQRNQLNATLLDLLAGLLALVAFGAVGYALRSRRDVPAAVAGAASPSTAPAAGSAASVDATQAPVALLKALAQLDRAHDAGEVEDAAYRIQRAALKAHLKAHLLAQPSAPEAAAGSPPGGRR